MLNRRQFGSYVLGAAAAATVATESSAQLSNNNGPVIQLAGVPGRVAIQMHSGNTVDHTLGCILLGSTAVSQAPQQGSEILASGRCWIAGSKAARNELPAVYGWTDLTQQPPARPVMVIVS